MLSTKDELIVAPRSTCTKDEAVARLLGWMKGPAFPQNIPFGPFGVPTNQYVNLQFLEGSIQNQLTIYRETARQEWIAANESDMPDGGLTATVLLACYDLAAKAEKYLIEIDDEIAKGDASVLRIDKDATAINQETHYTLKSVEEWAMKTLGLSVITDINCEIGQENKRPNPEIFDDESAEKNLGDGKGLGERKANNLYIAFALLVEEFAKKDRRFSNNAGDAIEVAIAQHLAVLGMEQNGKFPISGVATEAIRKHIAEAFKRKAKKLHDG